MFSLTVYSRLDLERKPVNLFLSISPPHLSYLSSTKVLSPLAATLTLCNLLPGALCMSNCVFTPYFSQLSLCFNLPSHPGWTLPHSLDLQVPTFPPSPLTGHIPATCSSQWVSAFSLLCELFPQSARLSENHMWVRCHCLVGILSTASVNNTPILSEFASAGVWHVCGVSQCKAWAPVWLP